MDQVLREKLLKWYFDQDGSTVSSPPSPDSGPINATETIQVSPLREEGGRVSFPEFVRAGLLSPGTELICKALKRQKRSGAKTYIEAGKVLADGNVNYRGQHYLIPSKLAVDVVNANGGNTKALNGYDYLFVRVSNRIVPLKELRDRFAKQNA
jgi:hypothetical protein